MLLAHALTTFFRVLSKWVPLVDYLLNIYQENKLWSRWVNNWPETWHFVDFKSRSINPLHAFIYLVVLWMKNLGTQYQQQKAHSRCIHWEEVSEKLWAKQSFFLRAMRITTNESRKENPHKKLFSTIHKI